jgi:hypothetical protein
VWWPPDESWLFAPPCTFVDRTGRAVSVCDPASVAPRTWALRVDHTAASVTRNGTRFDVHVRDLVTGSDTVLPPLPSMVEIWLSPDARTVVAVVRDANYYAPAGPTMILEAPSSGGTWATLGSNVWHWSSSDDSRFIGMARFSGPPLISVDGAPGIPASAAGLDLNVGLTPKFEPIGGFGKAVFYERDSSPGTLHSVVGNADGSGDWLRMPTGVQCLRWVGHTALCWNDDLYAVRGDQYGVLARGGTRYTLAEAARKVFFASEAGLFAVDVPGP